MIMNIWKLIKMAFGCSKEELDEVVFTLPYGVKQWKEIKPMKNLKTNVMETVALDLGVGFNQPFILTDGVGVKFVVHIDENGIYNETSGSYLNGNSIMKILDGKYKSEELPWCPKLNEPFLKAFLGEHGTVCIMPTREIVNYSSGFLCRLNSGVLFPYTKDKVKIEEYRQIAVRKFRSIAGQYGLQVDVK